MKLISQVVAVAALAAFVVPAIAQTTPMSHPMMKKPMMSKPMMKHPMMAKKAKKMAMHNHKMIMNNRMMIKKNTKMMKKGMMKPMAKHM